jgi:hypothetical protein
VAIEVAVEVAIEVEQDRFEWIPNWIPWKPGGKKWRTRREKRWGKRGEGTRGKAGNQIQTEWGISGEQSGQKAETEKQILRTQSGFLLPL